MNCDLTALAFGRALFGAPGLTGVHIYAHDREVLQSSISDRVLEMVPPGIGISVSGVSLLGSPKIGMMKAVVCVGSQSDTDTAAVHSARETAVRARLADFGALTAAFAAIGGILAKGPAVLVQNDPGVETRSFWTPLTYRIGVETTG